MKLLSEVDFISAKAVQIFKRHGIKTVADLLYSFPAKFADYTIVSYDEIDDLTKTVSVAGIVQGKAAFTVLKNNLNVLRFPCEVNGKKIRVSIFNRYFLRTKIGYGVYVRLTGKFDATKTKFTASEITFNEFENQIQPVFNLKGLSDKKIAEIKEKVYDLYQNELIEDIPQEVRTKYDLVPISVAIKYINFPDSMDEAAIAMRRIKFEELFKYQIKVKYMFYMRKSHPEGICIKFDHDKVNEFIASLPYRLTCDQEKALADIFVDMESNYKMNRLLQGEVGSGKTVVAAISLYAAVTAGFQGAIMAPTEVLSHQHFKTFSSFFKNTNIRISLLTSSIKEKKEILADLTAGKIDILIGTHSLFQKDVRFRNLGLVVTDEEHRFGVKQRVSLIGKGYLIDHLKMSATPIPRTLAISLLGESDISQIKVLPGMRKEVITKYIAYDDRDEVFTHIRNEILRGKQVYIITPMIEESEVMDLQNALDVYQRTKKYYRDLCSVGLIHGKMKPDVKKEVMQDFTAGKIKILVATSLIEVGVNVENATTIIILDADRFGVAQLHQMRGRVRRSDAQAYCFLISKANTELAVKRLQLVESTNDGFRLAEEDLINRGAGDLFGEKQSGDVTFKMADIVADSELLNLADCEADEIIQNGKLFRNEEYQNLLKTADDNYRNKKEMLE